MTISLNQNIAHLLTRLLLGFIFLMQGFGKVFKIGVDNVYNGFFKGQFEELLPDFLLLFTAYYTSYIELLGGLLLIIGFKTNWTLYALGSVLVIVTFGHGLAETIWDMQHMMYRAILLITLLVFPTSWDRFSMDGLLRKK